MKYIIAVFMLIAAFVIFGIWALNNVYESSNSIIHDLNSIEELINEEKWEHAKEEVIKSQEKWNEKKGIWVLLMDRHDLTNIDVSFNRIIKFIEAEDKSSTTAEIAEVKYFMSFLPETQTVNLKNIF